jgi:hypothetical protein
MMYRRIMLACALWPGWSAPSSAKYRSAVNWASTRFNQDEFVGVQVISALFAAAYAATRPSLTVVRCGLKLSQMIAMRTSGEWRERR